jgi:hypothetical protein
MKKVILIIAILLIFLALFRTFYSEPFMSTPYLNTIYSNPQPFFGDAEDDSDVLLIKEYNDTLQLSSQCNSAKNAINKSVTGLRTDLKNRKTAQQTTLNECKLKVPGQIERYKRLFKAVNGREPTPKELDSAKGFYEI